MIILLNQGTERYPDYFSYHKKNVIHFFFSYILFLKYTGRNKAATY